MENPSEAPRIAFCGPSGAAPPAGLVSISSAEVRLGRFHALVLGIDGSLQDALLHVVRASPNWLRPVYVQRPSPLSDALGDGPPPEDIAIAVARFDERLARLAVEPGPALADRLALYLACRPDAALVPVWRADYPRQYAYPLLDCWTSGDHLTELAALERDGTLVEASLVDRVRLCEGCEKGLLNYVDVCPSCKSLQTRQVATIHCFTCGHVDDQERFLTAEGLTCRNCLTRLKHIGVDYDRPLESFVCDGCSARFVEGEVIARCRQCDKANDPASLVEWRVRSFVLGDVGRRRARHGTRHLDRETSWGEPMTPWRFRSLLHWLSRASTELELPLQLLAVRLHAEPASARGLGAARRVDELERRLQQDLRAVDVSTRYAPDLILLLLPGARALHVQRLKGAVAALAEGAGLGSTIRQVERPATDSESDVDGWLARWLENEGLA